MTGQRHTVNFYKYTVITTTCFKLAVYDVLLAGECVLLQKEYSFLKQAIFVGLYFKYFSSQVFSYLLLFV